MFAAIVLNNFRLQAAMRWRDDLQLKAVALIDESSKKTAIIEITAFATEQGVRIGHTSSQGLTLCPFLTLLPRATKDELLAEDIMLEIAFSLTPDVELTELGCCILDMRKVPLKKDWETWCELIIEKFKRLNFDAKVGVGRNPDLAYLAAKQALSYSVIKKPEKFLADIQISQINSDIDLQNTLDSWGIYTVAQLTKLSRGDLTDRLGLQAKRLWELAAGKSWRVLNIAKQKEHFVEEFIFEDEVSMLSQLEFPLERLLIRLLTRLEIVNRVVSTLTLKLFLNDDSVHKRLFTIPSPTKDLKVLTRILFTHLEDLKLELPLIGIELKVQPSKKYIQQYTLFDTVVKDEFKFNETIGRLRAMDGLAHVGVARKVDTYKPDSFTVDEPNFHTADEEADPNVGLCVGAVLKRFRPSIPADVKVINLVPTRVRSAKANGKVTDKRGPFRFCGQRWDDKKSWHTEEWDVEVDGLGLFRLAKTQDKWHVEGCYDSNLY